ncbi:MAG: lysophospholipid acyltransferase family protein [Candidatus Moraniibacteriota bacterium]
MRHTLQKKSLRDRAIDVAQVVAYAIFIWPLRYIFRIQVEGLDRVVVTKPYIVISNHQSMWDAALVLSAIGMRNLLRLCPMRFPINHPLFHWPVIRTIARIIGLYEIKPKGDLDKSLESTFEQIDNGSSLFFFPEARMVRNGGLGQPKKGAAWIVTHREVFLQPARIFSDRHDSHGLGKPWRARVVFGDTVDARVLREQFSFEQLPMEIMRTITGLNDAKLIAKRWRKVFSVQVVDAFQEEYLRDLLSIEAQSFADHLYPDAEQYYREFLMNPENMVIFLTYGGERVGQMLLRPHESACEDLKEDDQLMKPDKDRYYVESLAILPAYRGSFGFLDLVYKAVEQAERRGIRKFSMHIRKTRGLSGAFQQLFGKDITLIRHIDSWKWMNDEPYDYIEATQTRSLASLRRLILMGKCLQILKKALRMRRRKRRLR